MAGRQQSSGESFERQFVGALDDAMVVVDRVLDVVVTGRNSEPDELFDPLVKIRIVDRHGAWEGRGGAAMERLLDAVGHDPAFRGRQTLGDVHPALPTFLVVMRYELEDGRRADRVLAVSVASGRITDLAYYRLDGDEP